MIRALRRPLALLALALSGAAGAVEPALPAFPPLDFKPPKGERVELPNGMTLFLLADRELPVIEGQALIRTGSVWEPADKTGLADLAGRSLRAAGSAKFPADKTNETLEFLGASVETGMGPESGHASFWALSKDVDTVLEIFADHLMHPAFEEAKVELERQKMLETLRRRNDNPMEIARREARRMLYGPQHPYGRREEVATLESVTAADLRAFHGRYYKPGSVYLALVGDFETKAMAEKVKKAFAAWPKGAGPKLTPPPTEPKDERKVYLMARPITQASVRWVQFGFPRHHPDRFAFEVLNDILGGNSFISRLFTEVRSRKGLAYATGSFFSEPAVPGMIGVAAGTRNDAVGRASDELLAQVERLQKEPVSEAELKTAVDSTVQGFVFRFQTPMQVLGQRMSLEYYGYPADYLDTYAEKIRKVSSKDVQAAARKWLKPEKMMLYVVGDPSKFDKDVSAYGPVIQLDAN